MSAYFQPYFEALWPIVEQEDNDIQAWSGFFSQLDAKLQDDSVAHWGWSSPEALVEKLMEEGNAKSMKSWLTAFLTRRKVIELRGVSNAWLIFARMRLGISFVTVHTPYELSDSARSLLIKRLEARWQLLEIRWNIDPSLVGGARCYMDDYCWDLSIKTQIETLAMAFGIRGIT